MSMIINWIRKYWWIVMLFLIAFPFILNYAVTRHTPFDLEVAGKPKDWIVFWGAYISSIASIVMIYCTFRIIKHNEALEQGKLIFRILIIDKKHALEFKNIGKSTVILESIIFNDEFIKSSCIQKNGIPQQSKSKESDLEITTTPIITYEESYMREKFGAYAKGKTYINPNEERYISLIDLNSASDETKKCTIHITGSYRTNNIIINFDEKFCIGDLALYHIPPSKQSKENKIISAIENLNNTLNNKENI